MIPRAVAARWRSLPRGLGEALWIALTMRVLLSLFAFYVATEEPMWAPCHFEEAHNGWRVMPPMHRTGVEFKLVGIWERWDACWYVKIAHYGYDPDPDADETAFFPLLPGLMRLVSPLVGGDVILAGLVVPTIALVFALWGIHRFVARDFGEDVARRTILYLGVFPTAFFFLAPYTESLFLAFAVWAVQLAREGRWGTAAAAGVFAGMTRPVGALVGLPILWLAFVAWRGARPRPLLAWIAAAAPLVGLALFTVYAMQHTGETPLDAQRRWWGWPTLDPPWALVGASLEWIRRTGSPLQALNLVVLLGATVLFAIGLRRLPLEYSLFSAPHLFLALTRILPTPLTSTTRYLAVVFPLFVVLALLTSGRRAQWTWVIASVLFLALLAHGYLRGDFVALPGTLGALARALRP